MKELERRVAAADEGEEKEENGQGFNTEDSQERVG